jgi:hypothetical protein
MSAHGFHRWLLATILFCVSSAPARAQQPPAASDAAAKTVAAAEKFIAALDEIQRGKLLFDFKNDEQRRRWSNLPVNSVPRAGVRMGDLSDSQRESALAVLAAALGPMGYEKTLAIVEADEALKNQGGGRGGGGPRGDRGDRRGPDARDGRGGPERGGPPGPGEPSGRRGRGGGGQNFGRDQYFMSFLGKPSITEPWMIQFGGHHLGINITLAGKDGTLAPSHTGAQPALYELEGKTVRPLGREVDKSFALLKSLDEAQQKKAILGFDIRDLVLGPGRDGQTIQPEGIQGSELNERQREMLLDLASEWTGIMHDAAAQAKMTELKQHIADTWFAWSGPTEEGAAAYFRIQGPTVHIEYAPQRMGGNAGNHIHTIYRDPTNEYGKKWWRS